jgi:hypothetical protein
MKTVANIIGNVPNPKNNINIPPFTGLAEIIEEVKARYTRPQGRKPFNTPINNNELSFFD